MIQSPPEGFEGPLWIQEGINDNQEDMETNPLVRDFFTDAIKSPSVEFPEFFTVPL